MTGVLCGYYLILPFAVNFGVIFKISDIIIPLYDLSDYTTLFLQVVLGMGVIFLFPVLIYFLTTIGILTPTFMKTYRRHAIVLIMVVAAIITPADVLSMLMAAFPLLLLYEFSIIMCSYTYKKVQKAAKFTCSSEIIFIHSKYSPVDFLRDFSFSGAFALSALAIFKIQVLRRQSRKT
jgi:sec-independent protein translocase protein TatC